MAGEAKTAKFMLGTASVMFGPQADVFDLTPATHGVGLTKSVNVTSEPSFTDLTQGVKNKFVYSVMTGNIVRASCEVYEYTAKNLAYALGLDGSTVVEETAESTLAAEATLGATSITVATGDGSTFSVGDWILIEGAANDQVYARKITAIATDTLDFTRELPEAIPAGSTVRASNLIDIGSKADQPFLSCKIVGELANGDPISLIFPKIRITNGFSLSFVTDDYGNLPFEMTMYDLVSTDPEYAAFSGSQGFLIV